MKLFILIPSFLFLIVMGTFAQQRNIFVFPSDSLKRIPRIENKKIDTLRYYKPGDTIPNQLWENYLKAQKDKESKVFNAPQDNMPVIVPPNHSFSLIVVKPDSTVQYHIRNLGTGQTKITPDKAGKWFP